MKSRPPGPSNELAEELAKAARVRHDLYENAPIAYFTVGEAYGRVIRCNKAAADLLGCSAGDLLGRPAVDLYADTPEGKAKASVIFERFGRGETVLDQELQMQKSGGAPVWVSLTVSAVTDHAGRVTAIRSAVVDISRRKEIDEALCESERKYSTMVEQSNDGIVIIQDGMLAFTNSRIAEMTGFAASEAAGKPFLNFVSPASRKPAAENYQARMRGDNAPGRYEIEVLTRDGKAVPVEVSARVFEYQGRPADLAVVRDISERRKAQEALRESEERYSLLFERSRDAIFLIDLETGRYLDANAAAERLTGRSVEALKALTVRDVTPAGAADRLAAARDRPDQTFDFGEVAYLRPDGARRIALLSGVPISEQRAFGIARDITERRSDEEKIRAQQESLYHTARLASIGEMASGIAHELNNPLTSVAGFSEVLLRQDIPADIRRSVEIIHHNAQRATGIVRNLLSFVRRPKPEKLPTNLNELLKQMLELRSYEMKSRNIRVVASLDGNLPSLMADPQQLKQVFLNIILNAEEAMAEAHGQGTLTVTTAAGKDTVRITFADDGPGIPEGNLKRVFEPFFTTKAPGKGTGLGLSICDSIVSGHGGRIYAESREGRGATFVAELPAPPRSG